MLRAGHAAGIAYLLLSVLAVSTASSAESARRPHWSQLWRRNMLQLGGGRTLQQAASAPAPLATTDAARAAAAANQIDYRRPVFLVTVGDANSGSIGTSAAQLKLSSPDLRVNDHPIQFFKVTSQLNHLGWDEISLHLMMTIAAHIYM